METIEIEITDKKAMKLLMDMEEMHLIRVLKKRSNISSLRTKVQAPMSAAAIDQQLISLRNEWEKGI
ncbi:hypothetical protein [Dyadobacter sp. CY343]|uniref:hypothetical protein n=1 Tax=Dyadobacter sp. CY343 TaxID=2907299 RepID=UPI001F390675|nr:hypothetical protein [Dyadobacter sp. CY343]MCE7059124.1 hypothetical protein [Dyadobacter sp. CY343]